MAAPATGIRVIPPLLFVVAFLIAWGIHWLWPFSLGLPTAPRQWVGGILIVATLAVVPYLFITFHRAGSSYETLTLPKALVTNGLYRFSRNPGYVDLIVLGIGIAAFCDNMWVVVLMILAAAIIRQEAVLKEEAMLESTFGEEYRRYKARVRRWL